MQQTVPQVRRAEAAWLRALGSTGENPALNRVGVWSEPTLFEEGLAP
jgi:hypothetical protein